MNSNDTKREREAVGQAVALVLFVVLFLGTVGVMIYGLVDVLGDLGAAVGEYSDHQSAQADITAGTVVNKEIVNGHTVSSGTGIVAGAQGSGVIIGGGKEYVPTQYRLYINAEYMVDGKTYTAEKYFDVPVEVYQAYEVGDYFDSQSFDVPETTGEVGK